MNSDDYFRNLRLRFLLECKSVVGGLSNVQLPTKGAKGSKNGTYSLRAAESRRRDHNHERIERSFSHFPIILSKNEFLLLAPGAATSTSFSSCQLKEAKRDPLLQMQIEQNIITDHKNSRKERVLAYRTRQKESTYIYVY